MSSTAIDMEMMNYGVGVGLVQQNIRYYQAKNGRHHYDSKTALMKKVEPKWLHFLKVEPFFPLIIMFEKKTVPLCKVVLKRYLNGGHPVDMKMAPPWSRFGSTFSFKCVQHFC